MKIYFIVFLSVFASGCVMNRLEMDNCTVNLPPGKTDCKPIIAFGVQVAAKPVDVGVLNPDVGASATAKDNAITGRGDPTINSTGDLTKGPEIDE